MAKPRVVHGFHAVSGLIRSRPADIIEIYLASGRQDGRSRELAAAAKAAQVRLILVERDRLDGLTGHAPHQGVAAMVSGRDIPVASLDTVIEQASEPPLLLLLDGVQDPHNLGACLRVADVFGAQALIVPKDRSAGLNATARKVASGAAETVPVITVTNLVRTIRELQEMGVWVIGAAGEAEKDLFGARLAGPVAWVMGAEGQGLRRLTREACDELLKIPMFGSVESLNVSVASGIALYETRRQRAAATSGTAVVLPPELSV